VQPDFAVAASYKWMLAPYTVGCSMFLQNGSMGRPLEENWIQRPMRAISESIHTAKIMRRSSPIRYGRARELALLPAAVVPCVNSWMGYFSGSETAGTLNRQLATAALEVGSLSPQENLRAPHYLCLQVRSPSRRNLPENLAREKVFVSLRGSSIASLPHLYNSPAIPKD